MRLDLGHFALAASWILILYATIFGSVAAYRNNRLLVESARRAVVGAALCAVFSLGALAIGFVFHDYRYTYVWQTSSNDMPWYYLVSAVWGGMDGSMLLWATLMSVFAAAVLYRSEEFPQRLKAWLVPMLASGVLFFITVVIFLTNPFRMIAISMIPPDGNSLNPLLQNPSMLIHPPMLYLGFTGFSIPCAFGLAALLSGELTERWVMLTRKWTLIAWAFLSTGIILGGNWAYIELGWGGFWAWDPVENASFLPWLIGTAFLHSVIVQERRGMLKVWNVALAVGGYLLSVFGTFLTRSGVVQSVHAFAATDVGWVFLAYIGVLLVLTIALIAMRWKDLRPDNPLESYISREAAFVFNNLILVSICFATLWGVMFPVLSEAITGTKSVVGPPFFNKVNVPLFLLLMLFMGIGPLVAWRRASLRSIARTFSRSALAGSLIVIGCILLDPERPLPAISFGLATFVIMTVMGEFHRGIRVRRELGVTGTTVNAIGILLKTRARRYGGFLVHLGVAIIAISITASMAYKTERDLVLAVDERTEVGRFALELRRLETREEKGYSALVARVMVYDKRSGDFLTELHPEKRIYARNGDPTTEVDIRMSPREDLYLALSGIADDSTKENEKICMSMATDSFPTSCAMAPTASSKTPTLICRTA